MASRIVTSEWYSAWFDDEALTFSIEPIGPRDDPSRPNLGDDPIIRAAMAEWLAALMAESKAEGESPA